MEMTPAAFLDRLGPDWDHFQGAKLAQTAKRLIYQCGDVAERLKAAVC